jgi:hypothetical protein
MVLFDPAALPMDFDAKYEDDPVTQLEELMRLGRLCWINTEGDGYYTLGIYVRAGLPADLEPFAKPIETIDRFQVPSGRLFFTGVEYAFQTDDSKLRKYPHMGDAADVRAGTHPAVFFEFEYPKNFHIALLKRRLSAAEFLAYQLMNTLTPIGCIVLLAMLGSFWIMKWTLWAKMILPCGLGLLALPLLLSKLPINRKARAVHKNICKEFPGYGILLQTPLPA